MIYRTQVGLDTPVDSAELDANGSDNVVGWPVHEVGRNADFFDPKSARLLEGRLLHRVRLRSHPLERPRHDVASRDRLQVHAEGLQAELQARRSSRWATASTSTSRRWRRTSNCTRTRCCSENTKIISFEPHLHAPGTRMCLEAIWGYNIQTLTCVGYDHNWVRGYNYAETRAAAAEGHDPPHHRLHEQHADATRTCRIRATGRDRATARSRTCSSTSASACR